MPYSVAEATVTSQSPDQLKEQIAVLLVRIAALQAQLATQQKPVNLQNGRCIQMYYISRTLGVGDTDGVHKDVSELQEVLTIYGDYTYGVKTGYFGEVTKNALIKWQTRNGLPASGHLDEQSRTKINTHCSFIDESYKAPPLESSTTTPYVGSAPMTVSHLIGNVGSPIMFTFSFRGLGDQWVDYGDGSRDNVTCAQWKTDTDMCLKMNTLYHTYTKAGTFTVSYMERDVGAKGTIDQTILTKKITIQK
jgi:hypothetical protein